MPLTGTSPFTSKKERFLSSCPPLLLMNHIHILSVMIIAQKHPCKGTK